MLEVCLAKYWSHLGEVEASYSVSFHGVECDRKLVLHGAHSYTRMNLTGALASEEVKHNAKFLLKQNTPTFSSIRSTQTSPSNRVFKTTVHQV